MLLALYYKGAREDLDANTYGELRVQAAGIIRHVFDHDWTER